MMLAGTLNESWEARYRTLCIESRVSQCGKVSRWRNCAEPATGGSRSGLFFYMDSRAGLSNGCAAIRRVSENQG